MSSVCNGRSDTLKFSFIMFPVFVRNLSDPHDTFHDVSESSFAPYRDSDIMARLQKSHDDYS